MQRSFKQRNRAGFSLIELVIVMTIMALLVGVVTPVASTLINREGRKATSAELATYADAVERYFEDTGALPANTRALVINPTVAGWAGPYLSGGVADASIAAGDFELDAWNNPYRVTVAGSTWTLASRGADRVFGGGDDLAVTVDVTLVRRRLTEERAAVINAAVVAYNSYWLVTDAMTGRPVPLANDWASARTRLIATGHLSNAAEYATDGWGSAFVRLGTLGPPDRFVSPNY